jgi:hypothetical protein
MAMGPIWVQMGLVGPWLFTWSIRFVVEGDSPWLLGSSGITRSSGAEIPGMVVVAYSSVGVGWPVE